MVYSVNLIVLATVLTMALGTPIDIWTGPTRVPLPPPPCPASLCDGRQSNTSFLHPSSDVNYKDRCFFSCNGGIAQCQCCNDDKLGEIFYNEACDRCVFEEDKDMTVCPTTQVSTAVNPCTDSEIGSYATDFCQNVGAILGASYKDLSGDYPFKVTDITDTSSFPLSSDQFLNLAGFDTYFISCVHGIVGHCMPCPAGLVWKYDVDESQNPKLNCGRCGWA